MKPLTLKSPGVSVELICEPEDVEMESNASAIGPEEDAETLAWIRGQLARGNQWAWCCAHVRVSYDIPIPGRAFPAHVEGNAYLGCCSYESEADFRRDYYQDMLSEALDDLNMRREAIASKREPERIPA